MKMQLLIVAFTTVLCSIGCGSSHQGNATLSDTTATHILKENSGNLEVTLATAQPLKNALTKSEGGWLIFSWTGATAGPASMMLSPIGNGPRDVSLTIGTGPAAIIIDQSMKITKLGDVTGSYVYTCGPHGSLCKEEIPTFRGELTYPCDPQGRNCRVEMPNLDDLSGKAKSHVCGPQGARCPGELQDISPTASSHPTICGPQGMRC